jgi:gamma-glutamylcyclotransferase (GGCT)/AIG2-like uncharacterized protein YtfP
MLYFAYGSNLHREDFARWCAERGHRATLHAVSSAWLPDFEAVFHYASRARGGGALDVRRRRGSAVPGVLFEVDAGGWAALDAKEGAPHRYEARDVVVLAPSGEEVRARTYVVSDAHRQAVHVPPTAAYVTLVCEGLASHGLPDAHVRAASRALVVPTWPSALFVYGTLLRGELRHPYVARHRPTRIAEGSVHGKLLHLGEYPGLVPCARGGRVRGELVELEDVSASLGELDEVEEFVGYGEAGSLYRRVLIEVREDASARRTLAWTYRYVATSDGLPEISSGDWRAQG